MYTVVIIDDNPWAITDIRQTFDFEHRSFTVTGEFGSAEAALPMILQTPPDLILTDIRMEDMNGLQLAKTLREKGINSLIVLISGYEQFEYAQEALRYEIFDYMVKPLDDRRVEELMNRVRTALRKDGDARPDGGSLGTTLDAVIRYVEENYMRNITLIDAAEKVYVNKNYLSELFSRKMGVTFTQYKNKVRIRHACEMIDSGVRSMTEIAMAVGFESSSRFSKVFRQYKGMKPQDYMRKR